MKKVNLSDKDAFLVREYLKMLNDKELGFLASRCLQNLGGDRMELASILSQNKDIERILANTNTQSEWFEMFESVCQLVVDESKKRNV